MKKSLRKSDQLFYTKGDSIMSIFTILFFVPALIISLYLPGLAILQILKIKTTQNKEHFLAWVTGTTAFLLVSYLTAFLQIPQLTFLFLILCFSYYMVTNFHTINSFFVSLRGAKRPARHRFAQAIAGGRGNLTHSLLQNKLILAIIIAGSLAFLSLTYFSGYQTSTGMKFMGVNTVDGIVHLAYIKSQAQTFPPVHPALAEIPLKGYHYFYDFLLSRFALFYGFSAEDLYFRLFPFFISLLYGASIYFFARGLTTDKIKLRIILFLSYFSQGTLSVFLLAKNDLAYLGISPPMYLVFDPSVIVGITFLLSSMMLFPLIGTKRSYALLVGIILGVIAHVKVYSGIVGISLLLLYAIYALIRSHGKKAFNYLIAIGTTGILTYLTFGINNLGSGSLVFAPLLFYREYIQRPLFMDLHWEVRRTIYEQHHNIPRIILMYLEAIAVVWLVNLGSKFILFLKIPALFTKRFWQDHASFLLFSAISISILLPSFFIQSRSVFDTVQFLWIALVLLCIPTGIVWGELFQKNLFFKIITIFFIGLFSIIGLWYIEAMYFFSNDPLIVKTHEVKLYRYITNEVPDDMPLIFLPPMKVINEKIQTEYHTKPLISAMTGRGVYLEYEVTPYVPPGTIEGRKQKLEALFTALRFCDEEKVLSLLKEMKSHYIVTERKEPCLHGILRGVKIESPTLSFYDLDLE